MVRRRLKIAALFLALLLLFTAAGLSWLLGTNSGAKWLLGQVDRVETVQIKADIEGAIWSGLTLTDLQIIWPGGRVSSDRIAYRWTPLKLLRRQLQIDRLEIGTTRVSLEGAAAVPTTESPKPEGNGGAIWPQLPAWLLQSKAEIHSLTVSELNFIQESEELLNLADIYLSLQLKDGLLRSEALHVLLPCGTQDGVVSLDLSRQLLTADLLWHGAPIVADWDGVHTLIKLDKELNGSLRAEVLAGAVERLTLQSDAALTPDGVTLTELAIGRSNAPDRVAGNLQVDWRDPFRLNADLQLTRLNLAAEAGWPTELSGTVRAELTANGYSGIVDLTSLRPGVEKGQINATVNGNWQGLRLADLKAGWLDGDIFGDLALNWLDGFQMTGDLQGQKINPAALLPELHGDLQLSVTGGLQLSSDGELAANWDAQLGPSRLQDRPLEGRIAGRWERNDLLIKALDLQGAGLHVKGQGRLSRRIDLQINIDNLAQLGQGWQGAVNAEGWLARPGNSWIGFSQGGLTDIRFGTAQAKKGRFLIDYQGSEADSKMDLFLRELILPEGQLDEMAIKGTGRIEEHTLDLRLVWPSGALNGSFSGGFTAPEWDGQILTLSGNEMTIGNWQMTTPSKMAITPEHFFLSRLQLTDEQGGEVNVTADIWLQQKTGVLESDWHDLSLAYLNPWLGEASLKGRTDGSVQLEALTGGALQLQGETVSAPTLLFAGKALSFDTSHARLSWGENGLNATGVLNFAQGGGLNLALLSSQPGRIKLPDQANLTADWESVNLQQLAPWLPRGLLIKGDWQGELNGTLQVGSSLKISGKNAIVDGELQWQAGDGIISIPLRQAELSGNWQADQVEGELKLLTEQGNITGRFRLPTDQDNLTAPLQGEANINLEELGLLALLMPGVANETHGVVKGDLRLAGTWKQPLFFGNFSLRGAGAEVPALGLKLTEAELDASFDDTSLKLERLQLTSGSGRLQGEGDLQLSGWEPKSWNLNLKGENIQLVDLPEITLEVTPDLQLSGTAEKLKLRGELLIPTLLASEVPKTGMIEPSEDVVLIDAAPHQSAPLFEKLDVKLQIKLGEHVVIKAKGLDARLEGDIIVATDRHGAFIGQGEIRVAQGHYATYGLKLPITRGRTTFSGGPLQDPTLDILAQRTVGEVKAGVQVTGTPRKPQVKLVSDPSLPDTEILSYIVLGRPLGTEGGQNDTLMLAAGALLSRGESAALQEKLKRQIGIDVLEVQSGGSEGVEGSMIAAGKYLTPDLYLSFGQSLFTQENVARLRYQLDKHWEVESQVGTVSGADLSYKIEFR
jgi:translocation and assembly module TamB